MCAWFTVLNQEHVEASKSLRATQRELKDLEDEMFPGWAYNSTEMVYLELRRAKLKRRIVKLERIMNESKS